MELKTIGTKVKCLFDGGEDRGVSPVIGVILMVAITVILAAVIGAFVLNLGNDLDASQTPTASVSGEVTGSEGSYDVRFTHNSGDSIDRSHLYVVVDGDRYGLTDTTGAYGSGSTIDVTEDATDSEGNAPAVDGETVSLIYDDGDSTVSFSTVDVPETPTP